MSEVIAGPELVLVQPMNRIVKATDSGIARNVFFILLKINRLTEM